MQSIVALIFVSLLATVGAHAQKLPDPARTIYKCTVDGKVVYTDDPCPGAEKVDIQPTRGMNKSTGKERMGADVRRERHSETMAEALKPLLNEDATQRATRHRRFRMAPQVKAECERLDRALPAREAGEALATGSARTAVQADLLGLRQRFRELNC